MGAEAGSSFAVYPIGSRHVTSNWFVAVSNWIAGAGGGAASVHATVAGPGSDSRRVRASTATIRHWIARLGRSPSRVTAPWSPPSGRKTRLNEPKAADRPSDRSESPSSTELDRSDHDADDADDDDDDDPAAE